MSFFVSVMTTSGLILCFFFSSRRRHTRCYRDWSSDVCSSDLPSVDGPQRDRGDEQREAERQPGGNDDGEMLGVRQPSKGRVVGRGDASLPSPLVVVAVRGGGRGGGLEGVDDPSGE